LTFTAYHEFATNGLCFIVPENMRDAVQAISKKSVEKHGHYMSVSIDTPKKPRTTGERSQNHHINGHCQQIAAETGQPFEDVKKYAKQVAIGMGYPIATDENGEPMYDWWGNALGISERDCSTEDAAKLIEALHMLAGGLGISLRESWE
jgi:hypothetical protein